MYIIGCFFNRNCDISNMFSKNIYSEEEYSTVISVKMFENCAMHSMGSSFKQIILNI